MRAADRVVGVVGVAAHALLVAGRVLQRHLDAHVVHHLFDVDRLVQHFLGAVQVGDELGDAALVLERRVLAGALVEELEGQPLVEKGQLAQAHFQRVVVEMGILEDFGIGLERDQRAGALGGADVLDLGGRLAAGVLLLVDPAVAAHLGLGPLAKRRHRLGAHAVQAGRHLVRVLVELGARAHGGQHHFQRRALGGRVLLDGDAPAVVLDADAAVLVDLDLDVAAVARQRLIDAVVNQLVDEVMQPARADVADVHAGPAADVVGVAQDLHVPAAVIFRGQRGRLLIRGQFILGNYDVFFSHRCVLTIGQRSAVGLPRSFPNARAKAEVVQGGIGQAAAQLFQHTPLVEVGQLLQ